MTRVVIVGNAPLSGDHSAVIDGADLVIRFNDPQGWGGDAGTRFDIWVLANGGGGRRFIRHRPFLHCAFRDLPKTIWLSRSPEIQREINRTFKAKFKEFGERDFIDRILRANALTQPTRYLGRDTHFRCLDTLARHRSRDALVKVPSAGFLALEQVRQDSPSAEVTLVGFTFQGASVHDWDAERRAVEELSAAGQITVLPV